VYLIAYFLTINRTIRFDVTELSSVRSVGGWEGWEHLDTADTVSVFDSDSDISTFSPAGSPGVLDNVVVLSVLGSPSNSEDTVVKRGSAGGSSDDSTSVVLEDSSVGLNSNGNWSSGESRLKRGGGSLGNIGILGSGDSSRRFQGGVASWDRSTSRDVWVGGLSGQWVVVSVLESVVHKSTIAAVVSIGRGAGNKLLLREGDEVSSGNEVSTLKSTSGGEGPAGTARLLVLNWGDGTLFSPVDWGSSLNREVSLSV